MRYKLHPNQKAYSAVEYMLLLGTTIAIMVIAFSPGKFVSKRLNKSMAKAIDGFKIMAKCVCYDEKGEPCRGPKYCGDGCCNPEEPTKCPSDCNKPPDHRWLTGPWGACSNPCGGIQTRTVQCQRISTGAIENDAYCIGEVGPKPATTKTCAGTLFCGDKIQNCKEECDTNDFGGGTTATQACLNAGYDCGTATCTNMCTIDYTTCYKCGDRRINCPGEQCDGTDFGGLTPQQVCINAGYDCGSATCLNNCTIDYSGCHKCGDGIIDCPGEQCDGSDIGGATCHSINPMYTSGIPKCRSDCHYDLSSCGYCGDGKVEAGEECDPPDMGTGTCFSKGFACGTLKCDPHTCKYITSGCGKHNDGICNCKENCATYPSECPCPAGLSCIAGICKVPPPPPPSTGTWQPVPGSYSKECSPGINPCPPLGSKCSPIGIKMTCSISNLGSWSCLVLQCK